MNLVPYESRARARSLWDRYQPRGIFSATLDLARNGQTGELDSLVVIQPRTFGLSLPRGPVEFRCADGAVIVSPQSVTVEGLLGVFGPPTAPATGICLEGSYGIDDGELQFDGDLKGMSFGSPVLPELLHMLDAQQHQPALDDLSPEGTFDASFAFLSGEGSLKELSFSASTEQVSIGPPDLRLDLAFDPPLSVRSDRGLTAVSAPRVRYRGGQMSFDAWVQAGPGDAPLAGDALISVDAVGPATELLAAMPAEARAPLASIGFGWTGGLSARGIRVAIGEDASGPAIDMQGRFSLRGGTIDAGPTIRAINASVDVDLRARTEGTAFAIAAEGSRASVSGRHVDAFSVRMSRPSPAADILVGPVTASVGGGVLELHGTVRDRELSPERPPWDIEASMAGCSLAALVLRDDLEPGAPPPDPAAQPGTVAGRLSVAGTSGGGRAGSGGVTLRDARLAEVPVGLALLQLTQLMLPLNASLNRAEARFSLVDDEIHFDALEAECSTLILSGRGSMDISNGTLALRLRNRGTLPIVSDIVGGLMEQVFQIDVRGTLEAPEASIAPIPAIAPMPTLAEQSRTDQGQVP